MIASVMVTVTTRHTRSTIMSAPAFTAILQPKGLLHRFIRSKDTSTIVERPERLRAVAVGIAAAAARLEEYGPLKPLALTTDDPVPSMELLNGDRASADDLADALNHLAISPDSSLPTGGERATVFNILNASHVTVDLSNDAAVRLVHGEAPAYLSKLQAWALESETKIRVGESEIPSGYSQGDLYRTYQKYTRDPYMRGSNQFKSVLRVSKL